MDLIDTRSTSNFVTHVANAKKHYDNRRKKDKKKCIVKHKPAVTAWWWACEFECLIPLQTECERNKAAIQHEKGTAWRDKAKEQERQSEWCTLYASCTMETVCATYHTRHYNDSTISLGWRNVVTEHERNDAQNSTNSAIRVSRTRAAHWVASLIYTQHSTVFRSYTSLSLQLLLLCACFVLHSAKEEKQNKKYDII